MCKTTVMGLSFLGKPSVNFLGTICQRTLFQKGLSLPPEKTRLGELLDGFESFVVVGLVGDFGNDLAVG